MNNFALAAGRESSKKFSRADNLYFLMFYLCVALIPSVATLIGDKALQVPFVAIAVITICVLCLRPFRRKRFISAMKKPQYLLLFSFLMLLVAYAFNGVIDDPDKLRILMKPVVVFLSIVVVGYVFSNPEDITAQILSRFLLAGVLISLFLISILALLGTYYFGDKYYVVDDWYKFFIMDKINRELEVISIVVFIAGLGVAHRINVFYFTVALAVFVWIVSFFAVGSVFSSKGWLFAYHTNSETIQYGLPIAMGIYFAAHKLPRLTTHLTFGAIGFVLLSSPWLFQLLHGIAGSSPLQNFPAIMVRTEIWSDVSRKVLESPFLGYGIDSVRYLNQVNLSNIYYQRPTLWHPHNMFLQIWLDLGLSGVLFVLGLFYFAWKAIKRLAYSKRPPVLASVVMLSLYGAATHSLWQTWNMALIATVAIIIAVIINTWPDYGEADRNRPYSVIYP